MGLLTVLCYWPLAWNGFVGFDDPKYILLNQHVRHGLSWAGIAWAFTTGYASNWHPLTWISHMVDCQLFGLNPGGHHLTSLLLHTANVLLLFILLRRLTGALLLSAITAALFAWHPLHVESVAWAAERKDVLSTFFFLLTLLAYAGYASETSQTPASAPDGSRPGSTASRRAGFFLVSLLFFALGLMSKPMLVTLPCVLLLLDYWPLRRVPWPLRLSSREGLGVLAETSDAGIPLTLTLSPREREKQAEALRNSGGLGADVSQMATLAGPSLLRLALEKLPFFALSLAASVVTYLVQNAGGAVSSFTTVPFAARVQNALVAYVRYLGKTIWPVNLSVFYPLPDHWPALAVVGSAVLLIGLTFLVLRQARRFPYLTVGWLWFLGTLVPVIGLVQVGSQSMADRYMYIPSIGLFIMAVWGLAELVDRAAPGDRNLVAQTRFLPVPSGEGRGDGEAAGAGPIPLTLTLSLGEREKRGAGARTSAGVGLAGFGLLSPRFAVSIAAIALLGCLACTSLQVGYWRSEETLFTHALEATPDNYLAYDHLAKVCEREGRQSDALVFYKALLRLKPRYPEGQYNIGTLLMGMGKLDEAVRHLRAATQLRPNWAQAHSNLGICLFKEGQAEAAVGQLQAAISCEPQDPRPYVNLGVTLLSIKRAGEAAQRFTQALQLAHDAPDTQFLLALALSRENKPAEAMLEARRAREIALRKGQTDIVAKADGLLAACKTTNRPVGIR